MSSLIQDKPGLFPSKSNLKRRLELDDGTKKQFQKFKSDLGTNLDFIDGINTSTLDPTQHEPKEKPLEAKISQIEYNNYRKWVLTTEKQKQFPKFKSDSGSNLKVKSEKKTSIVQIRNEIRRKSFQHVPHYLIPKLNDDTASNHWEISTSIPWPVYTSKQQQQNTEDLCCKRVKANDEYHFKLKRCHSCYNTSKKRKEYKKARRKGIYPYIVLKFAELLEQNPDPYFTGKYDWYYTGGNLCVTRNCYNNQNYIFHVTGSNLDNLVLSKIPINRKQLKLNCVATVNLNEQKEKASEIFEIQSLNASSKIDCILRQKYSISCYNYSTNDYGGSLSNSYTITNSDGIPFISFATDQDHDFHLITSNLNRTVLLWDSNKSTPLQTLYKSSSTKLSEERKENNWNCIRHFKRCTFVFTDLYNFHLIDTRAPLEENIKQISSLKSYCDPCERISIVNSSKSNENHLYFGTSHKLFATDVRYFGNTKKFLVSEWRHQMYLPSLILDSHLNGSSDQILLASPHHEDIRLCEHKAISPLKFNSSLPFAPTSTFDAFNYAKRKGMCLDTSKSIHSRINHCTTGAGFLNIDEKSFILRSNSVGDVFIQQLQMSEDSQFNDNDFIISQWEKYENDLLARNQSTPLNVTCVEELLPFKKVFQCKTLNQHEQQFQNSVTGTAQANIELDDEPKRSRRLQKWQRPISELKNYKDALAKDLLSIWDLEFNVYGDEQLKNNANLKHLLNIVDSKTDTQEKIADWFSKTATDNSFFEDDKEDSKIMAMTSKSFNASFNVSKLSNVSFANETLNTSEIIPSSQNVVRTKIKKKKHTIGF